MVAITMAFCESPKKKVQPNFQLKFKFWARTTKKDDQLDIPYINDVQTDLSYIASHADKSNCTK